MEKEMSVDQRIKFLKAAVEMGANIKVNFHMKDKSEAEKIANKFSELVDVPASENEHEGTYWFELIDYAKGIHITLFYKKSKEDIKAELKKRLEELEQVEEVIA